MICIIAVDSPSAVELIRSILEGLGLEIYEAEDGVDAISLAQMQPPDLLIVDAGLARIDGIALVHDLREKGLLERAKIIVLTGSKSEIQEQSGIDYFLVKPLRASVLRDVISELSF